MCQFHRRAIVVALSVAFFACACSAHAIDRLNLKSPVMDGFATAYVNVGGGMYHHERVPVEVRVLDEFVEDVDGGTRARAKSISMRFPAGEFQFESKSTFELVTRSYEIGVSYEEVNLEYRQVEWVYPGQNNGDILLVTNANLTEPVTPDFAWSIRDLTEGAIGEGASSIEATSSLQIYQQFTDVNFPHAATLDFDYINQQMGAGFRLDQTIGVLPFSTGWFSIDYPSEFTPVAMTVAVPEPTSTAIVAITGLALIPLLVRNARQRAQS